MGELERGKLIDTSAKRVDYPTLREAISEWDIHGTKSPAGSFLKFIRVPLQWKKA